MRTRSCLPLGIPMLAAVFLGTGIAVAALPDIVEDNRKPGKVKPSPPWVDLQSGVKEARKRSRPILVLYTADRSAAAAADEDSASRPEDDLAATFESYLKNRRFQRSLREFVLVALSPLELEEPFPKLARPAARKNPRRRRALAKETTPPEPIGRKLVLHKDKSTLLVLSFREQVVHRYVDTLPKRSVLQKELVRAAKVNEVFAKEDRRVGAILEKSLYAFEAGKRKVAVALVLPFTDPKSRLRMDEALKRRVDGVIERYEKVAAAEMKKGDLLEEKRRYKEALDVFEAVLQDFSFPSVRKKAAIRKGEIWRQIQLFTRIPR